MLGSPPSNNPNAMFSSDSTQELNISNLQVPYHIETGTAIITPATDLFSNDSNAEYTSPGVLHVGTAWPPIPNIPMEQINAVEQEFHQIVDNYHIPQNRNSTEQTDKKATSTTLNAVSKNKKLTELNITIRNLNGVSNCATFSVETSANGHKNILALVNKYLHPLTVCYDMGWQRRSSGTAYNSMSGHAFLVGANSNSILKRVVYSKSCCTCSRQNKKSKSKEASTNVVGNPPLTGKGPEMAVTGEESEEEKDHRCPMNFDGSSKSMEPRGAVACITALFKTGIAYVLEVVGDDNSSVRVNLHHSFNALVKSGIWNNKKTQWP